MALDLTGVKIARYFDYLPASMDYPLPIKVLSGELATRLKLTFHQEENQASTLQLTGSADLANLEVTESTGEPLLALKHLQLVIGSADLFKQKFAIDSLLIESPEIHARVSAAGEGSWQKFLPKTTNDSPASAAAVESAPDPAAQLTWILSDGRISGGAVH